ncbi:MAG: hypothetical protein KHY80_01630 [Eggerthella sp.]|nr:hypothetical protein [Eggerthella sp.]
MTISKKAAASTLVCVAIALLLSCFAQPAFATMPNCKVWGNQKAYTYEGITITHKAGIESMSWSGSQNYITGWAYAKTNSSIAEGKIGARAELYDGAGLLINSTKPIWNAAGEKDVGVGAGAVRNVGGKYYAGGRAYVSGTHIKYDICAYSPTTTTCDLFEEGDALMSVSEYSVNSNNQTYGSMVSANSVGYEPDLVSAVATNGKSGYVVNEQWADASFSGEITSIPVYAEDGETRIGVFEFSDPLRS